MIRVASEDGGRGRRPESDSLPPYSLEAEQNVIGSILLDNGMIPEIAEILSPEDFWRAAHAEFYRAAVQIHDKGNRADTITVSQYLSDKGDYERLGGDDLMADIMAKTPHAANGPYFARIVREKSVSRQLLEASKEIGRSVLAGGKTAEELIAEAEDRIFGIANSESAGSTTSIGEAAKLAMDRIARRAEGEVLGITSGFSDLDDKTDGFYPDEFVIIAARPSVGKSALALNIAQHVAVENGHGVLFVSLEMGKVELGERLLLSISRIDGGRMKHGTLSTKDMVEIGKAYERLLTTRIRVDDTSGRTIGQVIANCLREKARHKVDLVIIDYLQLIQADRGSKASRQEVVGDISRKLKSLARRLNVPLIALSQLNRDLESRENKEPRMHDLRESGSLEQDADTILLLHRYDYFDATDRPGQAKLIIAKNRNGPTGFVNLTWHPEITRFEGWTPNLDIPPATEESEPFNAY